MKKGLLFVTIFVAAILVLYAVWPTKMINYMTTPASPDGDRADTRLSARSKSAPMVIRKKIPGGLQEVEASYDRNKPVVITKKVPPEKAVQKKKIDIKPTNELSPLPATVAGAEGQKPLDRPTGDASTTSAAAGKPVQPKTQAEPAAKPKPKKQIVIAKSGENVNKKPPASLAGQTVVSESGQEFVPRPYSIMLASCRRMDSAQSVIKQNRRKGLAPYAVRVDLGQKGIWWRVFEGNYASRGEASGVKSQYNLSKSMVKKTPFAISIGAFDSETAAATEVQRLVRLKHSPYFLPGPQNKLRLLVGAFVSKDGARQLQEELTARGISNEVVVR